jgi:hypothetical protein
LDHSGELALHKACRGGHSELVSLLAAKDEFTIRKANAAGMLPVFLLSQASGKKKDILTSTDLLGAIWLLFKKHPEAILSYVPTSIILSA